MRKVLVVMLMFIIPFYFVGCSNTDSDVVRIHIRANSNDLCDQEVKLMVRDAVIEYITPLLCECNNSNDVKVVLNNNLPEIENVADDVLSSNGFSYISNASICNEYFPSRDYNGEIFGAGYYDALILNLGTGKGDNWWCVAYPPLCFVGEDLGIGNVKYKSKILELINKYWG